MKQLIFLLAVIIVFVPASLRAVEPAGEPPKAPFVQPPPEKSAWKITLTRVGATAGSGNQQDVVAIESAHYGESKQDVISYSNGSKREIWYVRDYVLSPYPDGSRVGVSKGDSGIPSPEPVESARFPGLDWLGLDSYQGVEKKGSVQCRHYVRSGEGDRWEAWIGLDSGLPVVAKFGSVVHTYTFTTPPAAPLELPPMYAQALESVNKQVVRADALVENMAPRPPFVLPPPEKSAWTIKVTRPAAAEDPQNAKNAQKQKDVLAIVSKHYGELKQDVVYYAGGSKREFWYVGSYALWTYPDGSRVGVSNGDSQLPTLEPAESPGFPGLDWLSASLYKDMAKIGDQQCRHYVKAGGGDPWEAWIGLESTLPVAARFGSVVHSYTFTAPPATPLEMPMAYAKALEDVKKQAARAAALAKKFKR